MSISICLTLAYCFLFYHSLVAPDFKRNLYYLTAIDFELAVFQTEEQVQEFRLILLYIQLLLKASHLVLITLRFLLRLEILFDPHQLYLLPPQVLFILTLAMVLVKVQEGETFEVVSQTCANVHILDLDSLYELDLMHIANLQILVIAHSLLD